MRKIFRIIALPRYTPHYMVIPLVVVALSVTLFLGYQALAGSALDHSCWSCK